MAKRHPEINYGVIAGSLKGRRISAPDLGVTRPPLTRLRRSIFDFLNPYLEDARFLDLFSGTGSYLFEALSRGATEVVGVEKEPQLADAINRHAVQFGVQSKLVCRCQDVFDAIPALVAENRLFDVAMIAPPQYLTLIDRTLRKFEQRSPIRPGGLILCQHDTAERGIDFGAFVVSQRRKYGNTTFTVLIAP